MRPQQPRAQNGTGNTKEDTNEHIPTKELHPQVTLQKTKQQPNANRNENSTRPAETPLLVLQSLENGLRNNSLTVRSAVRDRELFGQILNRTFTELFTSGYKTESVETPVATLHERAIRVLAHHVIVHVDQHHPVNNVLTVQVANTRTYIGVDTITIDITNIANITTPYPNTPLGKNDHFHFLTFFRSPFPPP
jgi:hypothetical protein